MIWALINFAMECVIGCQSSLTDCEKFLTLAHDHWEVYFIFMGETAACKVRTI